MEFFIKIQGDRHLLFDAVSFASHPSDDTCYVILELTGHLSLRDFLNKENHLETLGQRVSGETLGSAQKSFHWF